MSKIISCCPIVAVEPMHLIPLDHVIQPAVSSDDTRIAHVHWVQESESRVLIMHGQQILKTSAAFHDKDGYLTSVDQAYRECQILIEAYKMKNSETHSVVVETKIYRIPVFKTAHKDVRISWLPGHQYRQYDVVSGAWYQIPEDNIDSSQLEDIKPVIIQTVSKGLTPWSSLWPENEGIEKLQEFKSNWDFTRNKDSFGSIISLHS